MSTAYKKIMVCLDGSATANEALSHAEFLAKTFGAELSLFRVVLEIDSGRVIGSNDNEQRRLTDDAERDLDSQAEMLRHHLNVQIVTDVGDPAERIVAYAERHHIDLIVMTTHGRSGLSRMIYGSVAEKVLHTAPCAIFLIRSAVNG